MRENRTSGTVPGAPGNRSPYGGSRRDKLGASCGVEVPETNGDRFIFRA